MKFAIVSNVALSALLAASNPAFAQHENHQMPGMASPTANVGSCAQNAQTVTRAIDEVNARIEDARQLNDSARMRAAVGDLQLALTQMKVQLADCVALSAQSGGVGGMAGMDHSKMQMPPSTPVPQPGSTAPASATKGGAPPMAGMDHSTMVGMEPAKPKPASTDHSKMAGMASAQPKPPPTDRSNVTGMGSAKPKPATTDHSKMTGMEPAKPKPAATDASKMAGMDHSKMAIEKPAPAAAGQPSTASNSTGAVVALRTQPAPPHSGDNDFEVTLKDAAGQPISDANVSLALYMPAMPSMNMPAMCSTVKLTSAGNGAYKGSGAIRIAGDWDATLTAARKGEQLASKTMKLTVK